MTGGRLVIWIVLALVLGGLAYIRLAPSDPARWHVAPEGAPDADEQGGVLRAVETGPDGLERLDAVARAAPRTQVLAGSVADGMVTYVTRTRLVGFPDYTTAQQDGDTLRVYGRLRFGRSDFGVNRERVETWLRKAEAR